MLLANFIEYLKRTGWTESTFNNHYVRNDTVGFVAIDHVANEAYIVEGVGHVPWSRISSSEQFEQDLAHLQCRGS